MINRRKTRTVMVGHVGLGSSFPVAIQTMTKVPTADSPACIKQINQLVKAGSQLVRLAVPRRADTAALADIVPNVSVPLIADVHFSPDRAIEAIRAGVAKVRINPGNIKKRSHLYRIIDAAKAHGTAVRIGINEASIRKLKTADTPPHKRTALMLKKMKEYVRFFEGRGFTQLVLSAKSSDTFRTIEINRQISEVFDYPVHIGLTHAGLPEDAVIPSSVVLGTLLAEGIGDTIRVSCAGSPVKEVEIAKQILISLGLYQRSAPRLTVCPACGRAEVDVIKLARRLKKPLAGINKAIDVAVMGCIVNGPGEAVDADLAICAGKKKAYIYRRGRKISSVPEEKIIPALLKELEKM